MSIQPTKSYLFGRFGKLDDISLRPKINKSDLKLLKDICRQPQESVVPPGIAFTGHPIGLDGASVYEADFSAKV
jgi:hypothetical protein